ncbi:MAG: 3-hydroxyacyl-ACP dehydratase FabZ [Chloroflexia bacterium]
MLEAEAIQRILPHRYPFLLLDRVLELTPERAVGVKNVSVNEPFFAGHFPGQPIMPGVLILEALAQLGAVAVLSRPENQGKLALFAGLDRVRFRRTVRPGDQLELEMVLERMHGRIGKGHGTARVEGEVAAEGDFLFALVDRV